MKIVPDQLPLSSVFNKPNMTIYRFNDIANLRQEIAIAAARMIAEEGTSYDVAKRKAARMVLGNSRITGEILPDNATVENEVRLYNELFLSDTQPARLLHLRHLSLRLMKKLIIFNPYVTGAVLKGTGGEHSDIHLQLFTDNVKDVEIFLLNNGIDFDVSESPQSRGKHPPGKSFISSGRVKLSILPSMNRMISEGRTSSSAPITNVPIRMNCNVSSILGI